MDDLKRKLEVLRDELAREHVKDAFKANPNGYSVFPGCNEPDTDFELGFDAAVRLLWPVVEAAYYDGPSACTTWSALEKLRREVEK